MDPREYVDARWYALLRAADDLGVPEEDAPALVRRVLDANQRRIRRAEDPDPLVLDALREAVLGPPPGSPRRRRPWLVAATIAAVAVAAGVATFARAPHDDGPPDDQLRADQVPSLFGYDAAAAASMLGARGLDVTLEPFRACEVQDRVVGTDPPTGATYAPGDPITVYTSVPADVACLTDYQDIASAWRLLDFLNGRGPAPTFSHRVVVYVGDEAGTVLTGADELSRWADTGVPTAIRKASDRVALVADHPLTYALPTLSVRPSTGAECGVTAPPVVGRDDALSFTIGAPAGRTSCPLRVDLFRHHDVIDAVVLYPSLS